MKKNDTLKALFAIACLILVSFQSNAQIRIVGVNPATESVTIHNYGAGTVNITNWWLCSQITYGQLSGMTVTSGSLNLGSGADVTLTSSVALTDLAADLGLYNTNIFASTTAMEDFTQWGGSFVFPNGRENVAVSKGIWTSGTFITVAPPYEYTGNGLQNGFLFWATSLGIEDFEKESSFSLIPNPSSNTLNIYVPRNATNGNASIFDILGKLILTQKLNNSLITKINISNLENGLYLVMVDIENNSQTKRFIKN